MGHDSMENGMGQESILINNKSKGKGNGPKENEFVGYNSQIVQALGQLQALTRIVFNELLKF